jgi:protein-tyrosine kinase
MNIPYQHMEIEQIYTQLFCKQQRAIAICSANSGEGVTSMAMALAQRNLLGGYATLVVDLNLYRPALKNLLSITDLYRTEAGDNSLPVTINSNLLGAPQLVSVQQNRLVITGVTAPRQRENILKLRQPGVLEHCIEQWMLHYDSVIIDTSPLNRVNAHNIPPERVAAACGGAVLMVLAGQTSEAMVSSALKKLTTSDAQLLGCVFNDRDNPSLKNELLREVQRLSKFSWLSRTFKKFLHNNQLLNLDV